MKLALGTVQFGLDYGVANTSGLVMLEEARAILMRAHDAGMDVVDTAIAYGDSESVLGQLGVQHWKVVSKLPALPEDCQDVMKWVMDQTVGSLERLKVGQLHAILLHRPQQLLEGRGRALHDALLALKASGHVKKMGISVYEPAELDAVFEKFTLDLVQAPLNILDRRLVDSGWAHQLQSHGVEVHTRSAFLQGLLLMPAEQRPARFNVWRDVWQVWDGWLKQTGLTPLQACLRYTNTLDQVSRVLVGVDSQAQLDEILLAAAGELGSLPEFKPLQDDRLVNPASWSQL